MSNLKTLKDLIQTEWDIEVTPEEYFVTIINLKQSAIKWIKKWRHNNVSHGCDNNPCLICQRTCGKIEGVMKLNNITEEDLK